MVQKNKEMNHYPSNLTDNQWQVIEKFLDVQVRKRRHPLRSIVNAINYCQIANRQYSFPVFAFTFISLSYLCPDFINLL
jgi:hypothetical protein